MLAILIYITGGCLIFFSANMKTGKKNGKYILVDSAQMTPFNGKEYNQVQYYSRELTILNLGSVFVDVSGKETTSPKNMEVDNFYEGLKKK